MASHLPFLKYGEIVLMRLLKPLLKKQSMSVWSLDHVYNCRDPMTYLSGCGYKYFENISVVCGEYEPRQCFCGESKQNSYAIIRALFGKGKASPPMIRFVEPKDNTYVDPLFSIQVTILDFDGIDFAELWIDDELINTKYEALYFFNTPPSITSGMRSLTIVAQDIDGAKQSKTIDVIVSDEGCNAHPSGFFLTGLLILFTLLFHHLVLRLSRTKQGTISL